MIIDEPHDGILPCRCGYKPTGYSIAYGRTPYSIHCLGCKKSLHGGCNDPEAFIEVWNRYVRQVDKPLTMYGLRYSYSEGGCEVRVNPPLVYETRLMGLSYVGKPLNRYRYNGRFEKLPRELIGERPWPNDRASILTRT